MLFRTLLLGPNGQLGHDVRLAHAEHGQAIDLILIAREALDLATPEAVQRVLGGLDFNVLGNCAAYTRVDEAEQYDSLAFAVNAHAVQAMARACAAKRARFLHVSTDYVFGGDLGRQRPLGKHDPTGPINVYGSSKAMGETLARLASLHTPNLVPSRAKKTTTWKCSGYCGNWRACVRQAHPMFAH